MAEQLQLIYKFRGNIKGPSSYNLRALPKMADNGIPAAVVALIGSMTSFWAIPTDGQGYSQPAQSAAPRDRE